MWFLGFPSFIAFVPLSNLIIIPWPYLLLCNEPIRDKLQREDNFPHCLPMSLQAVRDIIQVRPLIFFNCSNIHLLGLKIIRDMSQHAWVVGHCLVAYFLRLILIWEITYCVWFLRWRETYTNDSSHILIASKHISDVLRWLGISIKQHGTAVIFILISLGQVRWKYAMRRWFRIR